MKVKAVLITFILVLSVCMISCKSGDKSQPDGTMSSLIDGSVWKGVSPKAIIYNNRIDIYSTSANGQSIELSLNGNIKGDYPLIFGGLNVARLIPNTSGSASIYSTNNNSNATGVVKISSINEGASTINGKFSFIAYQENSGAKRTITEGNFANVPYTYVNEILINSVRYFEEDILRSAISISSVKVGSKIVIKGDCDPAVALQGITINVPKAVSEGTYNVTADGPVVIVFQNGFNNYTAESGTLTISEHDITNSKLSGTFTINYSYTDEEGELVIKTIYGGEFDVKYVR